MRAVWSFWSRPFRAHHHQVWPSEAHHLLAWVLSVQTARQHFQGTCLVTDDDGARMLVDGIGLDFDHVSTALNALDREDPDWWCLGKLYAYRAQAEPFVHIDSDCFLWSPLPERLRAADLVAQHPEWFPYDGPSYYRPGVLEAAVDAAGGWLPDALRRYTAARGGGGVNCGILGGRRVEFIREYADLGIRLVQHPSNRAAWAWLADKRDYETVAVEQRLLAACIDAAGADPASPYHDLDVQYRFASLDEAFDPERAAQAGFTHLIGHTKSDPTLARRLAARVRRDYPAYYERCTRYVGERAGALVETAVLQEV